MPGRSRAGWSSRGPCALESFELALETAQGVVEAASGLGLTLVFKSSFDKANRTSLDSFRGPGLVRGLEWLGRIREATGLPVITDIHLPEQAAAVAEVADMLQIPAFLCRQTDLLVAAARTGRVVNVKKGQFVAPWDMANVASKLRGAGCERFLFTERGASFGYNNLVVDFRSVPIMGGFGCPVVFDATPLGAVAGRAGEFFGRAAGVRAHPGTRGHCRRRAGRVSGNAPRPGQRAVRRPQQLAAGQAAALVAGHGRVMEDDLCLLRNWRRGSGCWCWTWTA